MGPQWSFPIEWWYYGGWAQATSQTGNQPGPKFTLFLQTIRISKDLIPQQTDVCISYGVGISVGTSCETQSFFLNDQSFASGFSSKMTTDQHGLIIPPTTQDHWYCEGRTDKMQMTCQLISGILGLAGASYKLEIADTNTGFNATLNMYDPFGAIMELASGVKTSPSYEYALPCLNITNGSCITLTK